MLNCLTCADEFRTSKVTDLSCPIAQNPKFISLLKVSLNGMELTMFDCDMLMFILFNFGICDLLYNGSSNLLTCLLAKSKNRNFEIMIL